jgi:CRISPR-associated protein Cas5t
MLSLYIQAPFAACRTFTAGWYRPTATFLTPSMMYGLLLNLAGVETRLREEEEDHPGTVPASLTRRELPTLRIAIGVPAAAQKQVSREESSEADLYPRVQTIYQQLHNYPVGASGRSRADTTFGNKYNITPVRRELLSDVRAVAVLDGNQEIEDLVRTTLRQGTRPRYGLPFLGDNSFLPDRIEVLDSHPSVHWYERVAETTESLRPRTTRLTIWIDRAILANTKSALFAPVGVPSMDPTENAWTTVGPTSQ